jgi:aspartate aminotransferase
MKLSEKMGRLGTESAFDILARAAALQQQGKSVINLGIGQPDFPTPPHIVEAAAKALRDGHHGYTPANGILPLREAVAADIEKSRGVRVNPDNIVIMPGGKPTMFFAVLMFGEPGAEIMYPDPGFPIYESVIRFSGATPVPIELHESKGFSFSAEEVLAKVTPRTRLIILNSPANPTGGVAEDAEIDKLVAGLEKFPDAVILSDEIYESIRDRLIILDGWSKTYAMTGWRLGWSLWPDALVGAATRLAINDHSCVAASTQYAGIAALQGPQDAVDMMVKSFDERRKLIVGELNSIPGIRCVMPKGAFYAFPNITGTGRSSREMQDILLDKAGVATVSGTSFGALGEGFLRFSYANSADNIREAMCRAREALA